MPVLLADLGLGLGLGLEKARREIKALETRRSPQLFQDRHIVSETPAPRLEQRVQSCIYFFFSDGVTGQSILAD